MKLLELKPHYKDVDDERFDTEIEQLVLSGIILKYQDTVWLNPARSSLRRSMKFFQKS